jgi:hypothetical protein
MYHKAYMFIYTELFWKDHKVETYKQKLIDTVNIVWEIVLLDYI